MWQEFAKCGFSVYGRCHFSRLNYSLRGFLAERGYMGGTTSTYLGPDAPTDEDDSDSENDSNDPSWVPPEEDSSDANSDEGGDDGDDDLDHEL